MASRFDLALISVDDFSDDLLIVNGDFAIAESDEQHIKDTLQADKSWWKQYPDEGVNIFAAVAGPSDTQALEKKITIQLDIDGYVCNNPTVKLDPSGQLFVNPNATLK